MKPIDTTHALLEAAAQMLEAHLCATAASGVRYAAATYIPDVPLYGEGYIHIKQDEETWLYERAAHPPDGVVPGDAPAAACQEIIELQKEKSRLERELAEYKARAERAEIAQVERSKGDAAAAAPSDTPDWWAQPLIERLNAVAEGVILQPGVKILLEQASSKIKESDAENRELLEALKTWIDMHNIVREATIEECARVAESRIEGWSATEAANEEARKIAAALRALKDKGKA